MDDTGTLVKLSLRELQVLRLVARGMTTRQVAHRLFLSPRTVDNHVQRVMRKTGTPTRIMLVRYAVERGLVA